MLSNLLILSSLINYGLSLIQCPEGNMISECTLIGMANELIIIDDRVVDGTVLCEPSSACKASEIIIASSTFFLQCTGPSSCESAKINFGLPSPIPVGFTSSNFDNRGIVGYMFCDSDNSCQNTQINIDGDYPGGITITARGINSLVNSEIACNLQNGQQCRLVCSDLVTGTCDQSTFTCNSCNCVCTGTTCPLITLGLNCPRPLTLGVGVNRFFPEILCVPDFPRPDECLDAPFVKFAENGLVECKETADCCACDRVQCNPCTEVICDGERACLAIPIIINGRGNGASLSCNLLRSCDRATITAEDLFSVNCNGVRSCRSGIFVLNTVVNPNISPLSIMCGGDESCKNTTITASNVQMLNCGGNDGCEDSIININGVSTGMSLDCSGNNGCEKSVITLTNVFEFFCSGNFACRDTELTFDCLNANTGGCALQCTGTQSCRDAIFNINNINDVQCSGAGSCFSSELTLGCIPETGCAVQCNNQDSCRRSSFTISNTNGLTCISAFSCAASNMTFTNNINGGLVCVGQSACRDINIITLDNLNEFRCTSFRACRDTNIITTCNDELGCQLTCNGPESCFNANIESTNSAEVSCNEDRACSNINLVTTPLNNNYIINCLSPLTCSNARINTVVTKTSISNIRGITCSSTEACIGATFIIDASLLSTTLTIDMIMCDGINACSNVKYIFINAQIQESSIMCNGISSCDSVIDITCLDSNNMNLNNSCII